MHKYMFTYINIFCVMYVCTFILFCVDSADRVDWVIIFSSEVVTTQSRKIEANIAFKGGIKTHQGAEEKGI